MSAQNFRWQPRETLLQEWMSQQYGIPFSLAGKALGIRSTQVYEIMRRLRVAGRVHVTRIDVGSAGVWHKSKHFDAADAVPYGPLWAYMPREIAWGYLGFDPGEWEPRASTAAHLTAVSELRLAITGLNTDPELWTSERLLRRKLKGERGQLVSHLHDAWYRDAADPDKVWAIEVELTRKFGAGRLLRSVSAALEAADQHDLAGVLYFVRGEVLRRAVEGARTQIARERGVEQLHNLEIHDLDATLSKKGVA
ncbi:hypothetical protein [Nocardia brasiliensis]|uniref:hypothetical protein n=1 Tax=Nocardia brasiliensis TaxID=37326 RepID=UPI003D911701